MRMSDMCLRNESNPVGECEEIGGLREQMHGGGERGQGGFIALLQLISVLSLKTLFGWEWCYKWLKCPCSVMRCPDGGTLS